MLQAKGCAQYSYSTEPFLLKIYFFSYVACTAGAHCVSECQWSMNFCLRWTCSTCDWSLHHCYLYFFSFSEACTTHFLLCVFVSSNIFCYCCCCSLCQTEAYMLDLFCVSEACALSVWLAGFSPATYSVWLCERLLQWCVCNIHLALTFLGGSRACVCFCFILWFSISTWIMNFFSVSSCI